MTQNRPNVVVCSSASVDGRISVGPDVLLLTGEKRWDSAIGSNPNKTFEHLKAIHKPQATLEGRDQVQFRAKVLDALAQGRLETAILAGFFLSILATIVGVWIGGRNQVPRNLRK